MRTKVIEAQEPTRIWWGKFLVGEFGSEWTRISEVLPDTPLLQNLGWSNKHRIFVDLSVGHGVILTPHPRASPVYDLQKRGIYFCPLMLPFLEWFYLEAWDKQVEALPDLVEVRTPREGPIQQGSY